jgi:ribosome-associated translation inhibitor RaiA
MTIDIRCRSFPPTAGLRARIQRRASFALDRFADRVTRVTVRLSDANGPRGGADKTCAVEVVLRGATPVRASDTAPDAYAAIDRALHRAAQSVARTVERERRELLDLLAVASVAGEGAR